MNGPTGRGTDLAYEVAKAALVAVVQWSIGWGFEEAKRKVKEKRKKEDPLVKEAAPSAD